jgi:hypothetical protein
MSGTTDLNGILSQFSNTIASPSGTTNSTGNTVASSIRGNASLSSSVTNLQGQLGGMSNNYNNSSNAAAALLTEQAKVLNIIESERVRLESKKASVDNVYQGKKRGAELYRSNSKRYGRYTDLMVVFIVTLGLYVLIEVLSTRLTFVPTLVFEILSILIISVGIFSAFYIFLDIQSRSNMNFDQLDLGSIDNPVALNGNVSGNTIGNASGSLSTLLGYSCVGDKCCGPNTIWDSRTGMCVPINASITGESNPSVSGFTTLTVEYNNGNFRKPSVKSDSAYEFDKYSPV